MSSFLGLQICGIRSFNPNPENPQTIYFQKPLTVILGRNGAGKTTIIEALLNACSGIMPPGCGQEKANFISKVKSRGITKAQIRLIFEDASGKRVQICRSFQVTRNVNKKAAFSTLDSSFSFPNPTETKEIESYACRANDADIKMKEMLGVSPAVLEYVLLCHQEEANWPLSSPKVVKEIFDELFSAKKCVEALENIRSMSKSSSAKLKLLEGELKRIEIHRQGAKLLRAKISGNKKKIQQFEKESNEIYPNFNTLLETSNELDKVQEEVEELLRLGAVLEGKIEEKSAVIKTIEHDDSLSQFSHLSLEEKRNSKAEIESEIIELTAAISKKQTQLNSTEKEMRLSEGVVSQLQEELKSLEEAKSNYENQSSQLRELLERSGDLTHSEDEWTEDSIQELINTQSVGRTGSRNENNLAEKNAIIDQLEIKKQEILQCIGAESNSIEVNKGILREQQQLLNTRQKELDQLKAVQATVNVEELRKEIADKKRQVALLDGSHPVGVQSGDAERIQAALQQQGAQVKKWRAELSRASVLATEGKEVEMLKRNIQKRRDDLQKLMKDHDFSSSLLHYFGVSVSSSTPSEIFQVSLEIQNKLSAENLRFADISKDLFDANHQIKNHEKQIKQLTSEMSHLEESRSAVYHTLERQVTDIRCDTLIEEYEERIQRCSENLESERSALHKLEAHSICVAAFLDTAGVSHACPLCERKFNTELPHEEFLKRAQVHKASPQLLSEAEKKVKAASEMLLLLENARPLIEKIRQFTFQIEHLQKILANENQEREKLEVNRFKTLQGSLVDKEKWIEQARLLSNRFRQAEMMAQSIQQLEEELQTKQKTMKAHVMQPSDALGRAEEEVSENSSVEELMDCIENAMSVHQDLHSQLLLCHQLQSGKQETIEKLKSALEEDMLVLNSAESELAHKTQLEDEIQAVQKQIYEGKQKLDDLTNKHSELEKSVKDIEQSIEAKRKLLVVELKNYVEFQTEEKLQLKQLSESILNYIRSNVPQRILEKSEELKSSQKALEDLKKTYHHGKDELSQMEKNQKNYQANEEVLNQSISMSEKNESLSLDKSRLEEINEKILLIKREKLKAVVDFFGVEALDWSLHQSREKIRSELLSEEKKKAEIRGSIKALQDAVTQMEEELASENYRNVEKQYKVILTELTVTKMCIKDLGKVYGALEMSLQSYHREQMERINRNIAALWHQTYLGSDIDTIEVRSDSEQTSVESGRRNYQYRVVMKRGDSEIDMRGQCSAGQKVLASIIIRLALSEVFCSNCGIFALDEPTTNLDQENAQSLAESLCLLIKNRQASRNFQLIVITHDEKFVRALRSDSLDKFYFVTKDREGVFSVIQEIGFDHLFR